MNASFANVRTPEVASGQPIIRYADVGLSYGSSPILQDIDLDIGQGEFVSIVGPSGCGKTTLVRLVAGLARQDRGQVICDGAPVTGPRQQVAMVFQDYSKALLPWRTAAGNVALALEAMKIPKAERADRIAGLLETMGLGRDAAKLPGQMSGGMQQRLQIARCLAQSPSVLLMDEPFGALDAITRQSLQDEVMAIAAKRKMTVVLRNPRS